MTKDEIKRFSTEIDRLKESYNMTALEAIMHYCETTGMELEVAAKSISKQLKSKIKSEAATLNLLKK